MKKILSFVLLACLLVPCSLFFTACKEEEPRIEVPGMYQVSKVVLSSTSGSEVVTREDYEELKSTDLESVSFDEAMEITLKLTMLYVFDFNYDMKEDNTFEVKLVDPEGWEESESDIPEDLTCIWSLEGNALKIEMTSLSAAEINKTIDAVYQDNGFSYTDEAFGGAGEMDVYYEKVEA